MTAPLSHAHPAAPTTTILIVEDDSGIAELERDRLEDAGYTVVHAATAEEALREVEAGGIDLVLLDYRLPGDIDGLDLYDRVRAAGYDLPVILVTGFGNEATAIRALRVGVRDFVTKSLEYLDYLPEAVARTLRQVETERRLAESEARLAGVIRSAQDAVIVVEDDRTVSLFNPAAERMFGVPAGDATGRPITDFIPDQPADRSRAPGAAGGPPAVRRSGRTGVRADGSAFPLEATVARGEASGRRFDTIVARDVTDRRRAEADLRRTADLLNGVVEGTTDAVFVKDRDGKFLLFNGAAARLVGRPVADVLGRTSAALFDAPGAARLGAVDRAVMASGEPQTHEETLTAAGVTRTFLTMKAPYRDEHGDVIGVIGIARDVTARRRLQAERDALLARLQLHIERLPLAYILLDAEFRVTDWNPAAERIFGYTREEMIGTGPPFEPIVPVGFRAGSDEILRRLRGGDMTAHSLNENRTRDGRTITCEWINTPLTDATGALTGVVCLAQDVSARRAAEDSLRLRDRAIRAVEQGILITDATRPDHPVIYASPGFERTTGYRAGEAFGRNCRFLQGRDTDPAAVDQVRRAVRAGEPCTVELLNYKRDGTPFWNELSISPVRDETGRLTHMVGVQTDVTERRHLEEQLRRSQKMDAFGQLASGVAHDFNNLLTVINGYAALLLQSVPPDDPTREMLAEIRAAGGRSAALTRQLLMFSRQQVIAPRVLDLNEVVAGTGAMLRKLIGEDVRLETAPAPGLWTVRADAGQLEQVLLNLAVNARDAMPTGGRLTIATRNVDLDGEHVRVLPDARPGPHVLLSVSDTGTGMTEDVKARIFEPFFTTKEPGKGTGLGLATVFGIVKQSGGHIGVDSAVGAGTTFKVYLPRADGADEAVPDQPPPAVRGGETVLLVEDEAAVRGLLRQVLTEHGYYVLEAADGDEAERIAGGHQGPIHILVTDVVMPGRGGRVVSEHVAQLRPGIRVLFVSGYTDDAVVRHGILHDAVNFLQKPFTPDALAQKVRAVLDG